MSAKAKLSPDQVAAIRWAYAGNPHPSQREPRSPLRRPPVTGQSSRPRALLARRQRSHLPARPEGDTMNSSADSATINVEVPASTATIIATGSSVVAYSAAAREVLRLVRLAWAEVNEEMES